IEGFIWPPEWVARLGGSYEKWILQEVKLYKDHDPPSIYIEAVYKSDAQEGVNYLDPHELLEILYQLLNKNIGKSLAVIGDLKITF
ncbi:MAG: hypothetical protein WCC75_13250, partial [Desulfobaccales bacterium]